MSSFCIIQNSIRRKKQICWRSTVKLVSKHTGLGMKRFIPRLCHFQTYVWLCPNVHLIDLNLLIKKKKHKKKRCWSYSRQSIILRQDEVQGIKYIICTLADDRCPNVIFIILSWWPENSGEKWLFFRNLSNFSKPCWVSNIQQFWSALYVI